MAINYLKIKDQFLQLGPVILFYVISITELSSNFENFYLNFFSFNFHMMIIYFWIIKNSDVLGIGHIFFAGIINDVVVSHPLGTSSLSYLVLALCATYIKNATLRPRMVTDWFAFIPAILLSNSVFFIVTIKFSELSISYVELIQNSFFTFLFFPIFYQFFIYYNKLIDNRDL